MKTTTHTTTELLLQSEKTAESCLLHVSVHQARRWAERKQIANAKHSTAQKTQCCPNGVWTALFQKVWLNQCAWNVAKAPESMNNGDQQRNIAYSGQLTTNRYDGIHFNPTMAQLTHFGRNQECWNTYPEHHASLHKDVVFACFDFYLSSGLNVNKLRCNENDCDSYINDHIFFKSRSSYTCISIVLEPETGPEFPSLVFLKLGVLGSPQPNLSTVRIRCVS